MRRAWVLDTETKGTGANVVPLEKRRGEARGEREPIFVPPKRRERPAPPPPPKRPPRFRVVDVVTGQMLADDADGRATVDALKKVRSVVDVTISRWDHEGERWRVLTLAEQRAIWDLRDR